MQIPELYKLYLKSSGVTTDSRQLLENKIFFALKGENFDANDFAEEALKKGAAFVVVDKWRSSEHDRFICVDDSLQCLQQLAAYHRSMLKLPVIAITGSNGKTTTKELLSSVMSVKFKTFSTPGNLNNHIGVPLCLLQLDDTYEIAVLELGANHLGENELLTGLCKPTHGITTNIGKDHLGEFGGIDNVVKAYTEFVSYFNQNNDLTFFLNLDDPYLPSILKSQNAVSFAANHKHPDFYGKVLNDSLLLNVLINYVDNDIKYSKLIKSKLIGDFNIYNILAAFAIGHFFSIPVDLIVSAIESYTPKSNRSQLIQNGSNTIILDAYNANPSSMKLSLDTINRLEHPNKMVILGDMFELGDYSESEHEQIVKNLENINLNKIILVGEQFGKFAARISCQYFKNANEVKLWLQKNPPLNALIYVKGSRGMKLESIFE